MKPFKVRFRAYKSLIYNVILFIISAGIIFFFLPSERKFKYEYRQGAPWFNDDLIAPFSFPVYKTQDELKSETDSLAKYCPLFFSVDTVALEKSIKALQKQINNSISFIKNQHVAEVPPDYEPKVSLLLKRFSDYLSNGVLDTAFSKTNMNRTVMVLYKNMATEYLGKEIPEKKSSRYQFRRLYQSILGSHVWVDNMIKLIPQSFTLISTLEYDSVLTNMNLNKMYDEMSLTYGLVQEGQRIISRGEVISAHDFQVLESLRMEYTSKDRNDNSQIWVIIGKIIISFVCAALLFSFPIYLKKLLNKYNAKVVFITLLSMLSIAIAHFASLGKSAYIYLVPWAVVPIIIRVFFDARFAILVYSALVVVMGLIVPNPYEFVFINYIVGVVAVFTLSNMYQRSRIFLAAISVLLTYSLLYTALALFRDGDFNSISEINYAWFGVNSLLVLWSYPLIYLFEKTFGFLSDVALMEVANTNTLLLRQLNEKAPGTFQHSLQVANMSESAIRVIGGNSMLVRAGALYHDVGKMNMPQYFIENQTSGKNPHEKLTSEQSARIIISHVNKGMELGRKHKLPKQVLDFISSHHGDGIVQYFYRTFINDNPDKKSEIEKFQYRNETPSSKEMAVVMLADSVEAAGRSLKVRTPQTIGALVEKIVDGITSTNQMRNAEITYKDIGIIKEIFKKKLMNIYHIRVEYPDIVSDNNDDVEKNENE